MALSAHIRRTVREQPDIGYWNSRRADFAAVPGSGVRVVVELIWEVVEVVRRVSGWVREEESGVRLRNFLKSGLGLSKNEIRRAKFRERGICVNGVRRKVDVILECGDFVEVLIETGEESSVGLCSSGEGVLVLYEDSDVIVVDKPSGLSVHPAGKGDGDTLANRLAAYLRGKGEDSVIRIVGRLDKDTSGVVLAAKNRGAAMRLGRQRQTGELQKRYLALVEGELEAEKGKVDLALGVDPGERTRMRVDPTGKDAVTHYEVLEKRDGYALVGLWLETGRMHQIRVHMAALGCPLLGDVLYGRGATAEMERAALHAWGLRFLGPFTGEEILVEAPVPEDFAAFCGRVFDRSEPIASKRFIEHLQARLSELP